MSETYRLGPWHVVFDPGRSEPVIRDAEERPVATVHAADDAEALPRAILIAKAPTLREAALLAYESFRVIAANDWGGASEAARKLLPYYEAVVHGLGGAGEQPA